jgi:hypothetical protein
MKKKIASIYTFVIALWLNFDDPIPRWNEGNRMSVSVLAILKHLMIFVKREVGVTRLLQSEQS